LQFNLQPSTDANRQAAGRVKYILTYETSPIFIKSEKMKNHMFLSLIIVLTFCYLGCGNQHSKSENNTNESVIQDSAQFFSQDVFVTGENNIHTYRIPSLITTNNGTVIALCDARVNKGNDAPNNIDLVMKKSTDGGKTWSESKVIADFPDEECAGDASMVIDKETGTLWVAYDYAVPDPQGYFGRLLKIHIMKSEDEGETWSFPVDISYLTKGKDFWLQNSTGVGLYTDDGVIIFPMYSCTEGRGFQTLLVYSKDRGKTWFLSNGVGDLDNYNVEPQIVSLSGGRIMANMRREPEYRRIAITDDLGKTWSEAYNDSSLIDPGCMGSLINYNNKGKSLLIFSNAADIKERKNMTVRISNDEGKSWYKELPVYSGKSAYSCLTRLPNGNVGLLFEADNYTRIVFVEIPSELL